MLRRGGGGGGGGGETGRGAEGRILNIAAESRNYRWHVITRAFILHVHGDYFVS